VCCFENENFSCTQRHTTHTHTTKRKGATTCVIRVSVDYPTTFLLTPPTTTNNTTSISLNHHTVISFDCVVVNMNRLIYLMVTVACFCLGSMVSGEDTKPKKFGVGLTTIPPRFATVHYVVKSWFSQKYVPELVVIFVPERYENFISESPRNRGKNIASLRTELEKHFPDLIANGKIVVQAMKKDWGPITKYVGLLEHFEMLGSGKNIDYWAIGDDDVRYSDNTLSDYSTAIDQDSLQMSISTHFKVHPRVKVNMGSHVEDIMHLQGVDTVLFPTALLHSSATTNGGLSYNIFTEGAKQFHSLCPDSFYQDDYVMSFLVAMSKVPVASIWSGNKVAHHVNAVSKSNQQMHIHPQVFHREENTKNCIAKNGREINSTMNAKKKVASGEL
jgi:hypothetical protein